MRRRVILSGLSSLIATGVAPFCLLPIGASAQGRPAQVGLLRTNARPDISTEAFRAGMRALGYVEGRTVVYEGRWADGDPRRLPALAIELAAQKVDVIVTGGEAAIRAALAAAPATPIVMGASNDPVAAGLAQSLARPGGTVTGLTIFSRELSEKRLEVLREVLPGRGRGRGRVAVLVNWSFPMAAADMRATEQAARSIGLTLHVVAVSRAQDLASAFAGLQAADVDGLITLSDPFFTAHKEEIARRARAARLPSMFHWREFVEAGGLLSYGPDILALYRRAASFVDKILKGAKPADLPIEQPTRFVLAVNLKVARELGVTIPPAVLARADEVID